MDSRHRLVIFDCDGVLIDSEALAARVELEELHRLGCRMGFHEYLERGLGRTDEENLWREIADSSGVSLPVGFAARTSALVAQTFRHNLRPIHGIREVLDSLRVPVCVASASRPERLLATLGITDLAGFFNGAVFSACQVQRGKPHPDLFLHAAERMDCSPSECVVVEDSVRGVEAGRAAAMVTLGFVGGSHCFPGHGERLLEAGAAAVFDEMPKLGRHLCDLTSGG